MALKKKIHFGNSYRRLSDPEIANTRMASSLAASTNESFTIHISEKKLLLGAKIMHS